MDLDCSETEDTQTIKVVLLGDRCVGKSSIIKRFIRDEFDSQQNVEMPIMQPTVGIDFMSRQIQYREHVYKLELWDTAGQEKYRSLVKNYLKDADCALFVYDVYDSRTYQHIVDWAKLFQEATGGQAVCMVVGNKIDLDSSQQSDQLLDKITELEQFEHSWVSAKDGQNIGSLFQKLLEKVLATNILSMRILPESTKLINKKQTLQKCCFWG